MGKIELVVNISGKELKIDGKQMKLEDTFTGAYIDHKNSEEPVLNLKYGGNFSEEDSPIEKEMDKLGATYGIGLFERLNISGSMLEEAHYLSFEGKINPLLQ